MNSPLVFVTANVIEEKLMHSYSAIMILGYFLKRLLKLFELDW